MALAHALQQLAGFLIVKVRVGIAGNETKLRPWSLPRSSSLKGAHILPGGRRHLPEGVIHRRHLIPGNPRHFAVARALSVIGIPVGKISRHAALRLRPLLLLLLCLRFRLRNLRRSSRFGGSGCFRGNLRALRNCSGPGTGRKKQQEDHKKT